jgi:D-alanine-D-alanine ligase
MLEKRLCDHWNGSIRQHWCWDGHLAKMAGIARIPYAEMLKMIFDAAEQRLKLSEERKI